MNQENTDIEKCGFYLVGIISTSLWIISEIIGASNSKSNGIIEFLFYNFIITVTFTRRDNSTQTDQENDDSGIEENDERTSLLR